MVNVKLKPKYTQSVTLTADGQLLLVVKDELNQTKDENGIPRKTGNKLADGTDEIECAEFSAYVDTEGISGADIEAALVTALDDLKRRAAKSSAKSAKRDSLRGVLKNMTIKYDLVAFDGDVLIE